MLYPQTIQEALALGTKMAACSVVVNFSTAVAAGGSSGAIQVNSWNQGVFVALNQLGDIWVVATLPSAPPQCSAGQSVARWADASPTATTGNSFPGRNQFDIQGTTNNIPWSTLPENFGLTYGTADAPYQLPVPRIFPPNTNITVNLTNNVGTPSVFNVKGQLRWDGYLLLP